jgi:hypothetical protein
MADPIAVIAICLATSRSKAPESRSILVDTGTDSWISVRAGKLMEASRRWQRVPLFLLL